MTILERIKLALAILRGAEIVAHLDEERQRYIRHFVQRNTPPGDFWMVEPIGTVWVPVEFGYGRASEEAMINIAPVIVPQGKSVTVVRW